MSTESYLNIEDVDPNLIIEYFHTLGFRAVSDKFLFYFFKKMVSE